MLTLGRRLLLGACLFVRCAFPEGNLDSRRPEHVRFAGDTVLFWCIRRAICWTELRVRTVSGTGRQRDRDFVPHVIGG